MIRKWEVREKGGKEEKTGSEKILKGKGNCKKRKQGEIK